MSLFCLAKIFAKTGVLAFWLDRWVGGIYRSIQWISVLPSSPFSTPHSFPFLFSFFSYLRGNDCFGRLERNMGIRCMREGVAEQHFCSSLHDDDFQGLEEQRGRKQGEAPSGQSTEFATYWGTKKKQINFPTYMCQLSETNFASFQELVVKIFFRPPPALKTWI